MADPKDPIATPAAAVEGAADGLADGLEREDLQGAVHEAFQHTGDAFAASPSPRGQRLRAKLAAADEKVGEALDKGRVRARAVAETARRAREAPPAVAEDLKAAAKAWVSGVAAQAGLLLAAGLVAALALATLSVGLAQGLNDAWGRPWGTFAVGALYLAAAGLLFAAGRGKAARGKQEAREQLAAAREEVRHVTRPVRRAFRGDDDLAARAGLIDTARMDALPAASREGSGPEGAEPAAPPNLR